MLASVVAALASICRPLNALATIRGEKCGLGDTAASTSLKISILRADGSIRVCRP